MNLVHDVHSYKRYSASTTATLVSGPVILQAIRVASVLTGQIVQVWDSSDATLATGTIVVGTSTMAANTLQNFNCIMTNGLTFQVLNDDVDLTIFYDPMGGNT